MQKRSKYGHFRGNSYVEKQNLATVKYSECTPVIHQHYKNHSYNPSATSQSSNFQHPKLSDLTNRHPKLPNTEKQIAPKARVYAENWKYIGNNEAKVTSKMNNKIKNAPYM